MRIIAILMIIAGYILAGYCIIKGYNLTQGQHFVRYLPHWILVIALTVGGLAIINNYKWRDK